jgi:acyl-CoA synthetase (AMP-forming)/AMP-acid ligase II/surfactin synthase thioesterase subunit
MADMTAVLRPRIAPGSIVAALLPGGVDLFTAILGIGSEFACAPLNTAFTRAELESCFVDLRPAALVIEASLETPARAVARELGIAVFEFRTTLSAPTCAAASREARRCESVPLLLQTSGTTGKPRLVPLTHRNIDAMVANLCRATALSDSDTLLCMTPFFHLQALLSALAQLYAGGAVACTPAFDGSQFRTWLEAWSPTWTTAGPTVQRAILSLAQADATPLPCRFRFVRSSGAPLPPDLLAAFERELQTPVLDVYGLTETGSIAARPLPPQPHKNGSVGRSMGLDIAILDGHGNPLPPGRDGEIAVRGACVTPGYLDGDDAGPFRNGWFCTGDLGMLDSDGFLYVRGRIKEMINRGGQKVMPQEIDSAIAMHPDVTEATAFAMPHPTLGEDVGCAVVLRPGASLSEIDLRRFAMQRLAPFKAPRRVLFLDSIPKGATGKPLRSALSEQAGTRDRGHDAACTPLERRIAEIWARILQRNDFGVYDEFFDLGGDSLSVTRMWTELQSEFANARLPEPMEFFVDPTVATLARMLAESAEDPTPVGHPDVIALQPFGSCPPIFCIPPTAGDLFYFRHLAQQLGREQPFFILRTSGTPEDRVPGFLQSAAARTRDAVLAVHGSAPFLLAGHCYGGIVAFETALLLRPEVLILFDTPTPGYPKPFRHLDGYVAAAKKAGGRDLRHHLTHLARLARRRRCAAAAITDRKIGVPIVHFIAAAEQGSSAVLEDARLGWRDFAGAGFTPHEIPGGHRSMFLDNNARALASGIAEVAAALSRRRQTPLQIATTA